MPYDSQLMAYKSIYRLANDNKIKETLSNWKIKEISDDDKSKVKFQTDIEPSNWLPNYIIAIDGSKQEEPVKNGFPMSEIAYITVASAILDMQKLNSKHQRPLEPKKFREMEKSQSIDMVFSGANIIKDGCNTAEETLREVIYTNLKDKKIMGEDSESLLDTYEALLKYRIDELSNATRKPKCPYENCQKEIKEMDMGYSEYVCSCSLRNRMYSTDAMRLYEEMNPVSTNAGMFSLIMQALERLFLMNIIRNIERKKWITSFSRLGFIIDGSLAVFSRASWLHSAINKELIRINKIVKEQTGKDILMIGIEKSGAFVEHFENLDKSHKHFINGKEINGLAPQSVKLLSDEYIKKNIIFSNSEKFYGEGTYFGRKIFYKSKTGSLIVATIPFLNEKHKNLNDISIENFPRLYDILNTIDKITSSMYPNSLTPIISAHNEATIPLNIGQKVLEKITKETMQNGK
jgi:hypothetical protein